MTWTGTRFLRVGTLLLGLSAAATVHAAGPAGESVDGLRAVDRNPVSRLYLRPDVRLVRYERLRLESVEVALDHDHDPTASTRGPGRSLAPEEQVAIRRVLAVALRQAFAAQLANARYVEAPEDDVRALRLRILVSDVALDVPDAPRTGTEPTYVLETTPVTATLELRDAGTGQLLARVVRIEAGAAGRAARWQGAPERVPEVREAIERWAAALRAGLDRAYGRGP